MPQDTVENHYKNLLVGAEGWAIQQVEDEIRNSEEENRKLKFLLGEIQDWMRDNDYECGEVGSLIYNEIEKILENK
jgi:hypothetical protein